MSYTDLRDFTAEYRLVVSDFETQENVYRIEIEAMGGGTFGSRYAGNWRAIITRNDVEFFRSQDFRTGTPHSHREAAIELIEYLTDDIGAYDVSYPIEESYRDYDGNWVHLTI